MKKYFLFMLGIVFNNANADCWINCDTINRNLSTDTAKIYELIQESGHEQTGSKENTTYFCGENSNHEMRVVSIEKDSDQELLTVNFLQFSPPKYGESDWNSMDVDLGLLTQIVKSLNFGIQGIVANQSEDKRCRSAIVTENFLGAKIPGNKLTVVCSYSQNANLPISDNFLKRKIDTFGSISYCKK